MEIENELVLLEKYKLTPTELFLIKITLVAQDDGNYEYLQRFSQIIKVRDVLISLQEKEIILKSFKIGKEGTKLVIEDIPFNKNFIKQFYKASFELGQELFESYPQFTYVNGQYYNLRRVSKKFGTLEDAYAYYGKIIKWNPEIHKKIIELIEWGKENNYNFTTLDDFLCDRAWLAIENYKNNNGINLNNEAVILI